MQVLRGDERVPATLGEVAQDLVHGENLLSILGEVSHEPRHEEVAPVDLPVHELQQFMEEVAVEESELPQREVVGNFFL